MISVADLEHEYVDDSGQSVAALRGVDLNVGEDESIAILGPSGSGKSTLLHILGALDRPTRGSVQVGGRALGTLTERQRCAFRRTECGFVFQSFYLIPNMTARENVALSAIVSGRRDWGPRATELLAALDIDDVASRLPQQLSGGQRQRVAVARAVFSRPRVVLADEPTGNLDQASGRSVLELLYDNFRDLGGRCLVTVTHDVSVAARAQRVVVLADGRIVGEHVPAGSGGDRYAHLHDWLATIPA